MTLLRRDVCQLGSPERTITDRGGNPDSRAGLDVATAW
jgi:hypothetical protein